MLIASLSFDVRPEKRGEFVSAVNHMMQTLRGSDGCLGCRLVSDCENDKLFSLISEWDNRAFLDRYLASTEFRILEGTRFLLRDGPRLSIDEVVSRGHLPGTTRYPEQAT